MQAFGSSMLRAFRELTEWLRSDVGQCVFEKEKTRIAALIPKVITPEILDMKIQDLHANKTIILIK
jgi:hypothetical protein